MTLRGGARRTMAAVAILAAVLFVPLGAAVRGAPAKTPETDDPAAVKKAIAEANARFTEAQIKGDAAAVMALYCEDGIQLDPRRGRMWKGRDSLQAFWTRTFRLGRPSKATLNSVRVSVMGSSASELGTYDYTYPSVTPSGPVWSVSGRYTAVWRKQDDGSWKIYLYMGLPFED